MTSKLLLCAFIVMNSSSAFGLNEPSRTAVEDIQNQIYTANKMDKQIGAAVALVHRAERANRPAEELAPLRTQVLKEKAKKNDALTKAIYMTIQAYGLEPAKPTGTSVMRPTKGRTLTWLPVAREMEAHEIEHLNGSRTEIEQPREAVYGITYPDGTTFMDPSAFINGPGFLASYLLHERTHFEQIITDGKANKMTYAALQEEAYNAQVDSADKFFDPITQLRLMQEIERLRDEQTQIVKQEKKESETIKGRLRALLPRPRVDVFEARVHTNGEMADISALVAQARSHADIARRDREEREARAAEPPTRAAELVIDYPPLPQPPTVAVRAVASKTLGHILLDIRGIAETACKYRGHIPVPRGFFVPNQPFDILPGDDAAAENVKARLSGCERHVFGQIYKALREERGDQITEQWFATTVASTPSATPPPTQGGGFVSPPQNGGGGTNPCERNGDPFGCQRPHR